MSGNTLRILIAVVLFVHGVGHVMGMLPAFGMANRTETWSLRSWLLTGLLGETIARWIGVILFLLAMLGFVGASLGLLDILVPYSAWRTLAVVSAVISLVALALYWNAFVTWFNKLGAIAVDVAVLVGLLVLNWPTDADLG